MDESLNRLKRLADKKKSDNEASIQAEIKKEEAREKNKTEFRKQFNPLTGQLAKYVQEINQVLADNYTITCEVEDASDVPKFIITVTPNGSGGKINGIISFTATDEFDNVRLYSKNFTGKTAFDEISILQLGIGYKKIISTEIEDFIEPKLIRPSKR